jgi:hypothetical protein
VNAAEQHRSHLRPGDFGAQGRLPEVAEGESWHSWGERREKHNAESDLWPAPPERGEVTKGTIEFMGERLPHDALADRAAGIVQVMEGRRSSST